MYEMFNMLCNKLLTDFASSQNKGMQSNSIILIYNSLLIGCTLISAGSWWWLGETNAGLVRAFTYLTTNTFTPPTFMFLYKSLAA